MKIIHTSDWHIGQKLIGKDREQEHQLFFDWLIEYMCRENIELLIVSGDIFDTGHPSNAALRLYYRTLYRISNATPCKNIVITGGNHDSILTLNAPREILQHLNVFVVGGASQNIEDEIIEIKQPNGEIACIVCAVPFLRDKDIRQAKAGESYNERINAIRQGILSHYRAVAEKIKSYKEKNIPVIATGHLFMSGISPSGSEREIHIGNLGQVEAQHFPTEIDYYALGHIHRPLVVKGNSQIRYSGSPLPLSFSERKEQKRIIQLETTEKGDVIPQEIDIPSFRSLVSFSGAYRDVIQKIDAYQAAEPLPAWFEITIEEDNYDAAIISQFEQKMEQFSAGEVLKYKFDFKNQITGADQLYEKNVALEETSVNQVFDKLLEKEQIKHADELKHTFNELLDIVNNTKNET